MPFHGKYIANRTGNVHYSRFPCLGRFYTPIYLLSVARCPIPSDLSLRSLAANPEFFDGVLQSLQKCMQPMEVDSINTMGMY